MTDSHTSTATETLLPCPFCGGEAGFYDNYIDHELKWSVSCGDCNANLDVCEDTKTEAAAKWNARPGDVAQASRDRIYEIVLRELETKHPIPTTVLLATRIANAIAAAPQPLDVAYGAWQPIETAPKDGTPIEACNTRHPSHAPVIVRWTEVELSAALSEPHWCDAATADGSALYYNQNYFDFWKPTTTLPSTHQNTPETDNGA